MKILHSSVIVGVMFTSEKMSQLYNQLRSEMLEQDNSVEDIFELMHELKSAAQRNITIKKLFWRVKDFISTNYAVT